MNTWSSTGRVQSERLRVASRHDQGGWHNAEHAAAVTLSNGLPGEVTDG